jgi:hypothetical protein
LAAIFFIAAFMTVTQSAADAVAPLIGAWKLNLQQSRFEPGTLPASSVMTIEDRGEGVIAATTQAVVAGDRKSVTKFALKCDGKEYPFEVQMEDAFAKGSISCVVREPRTYDFTLRDGDVVIQRLTRTVSPDGKILTDTLGADPRDGQRVGIIAVFTRQ